MRFGLYSLVALIGRGFLDEVVVVEATCGAASYCDSKCAAWGGCSFNAAGCGGETCGATSCCCCTSVHRRLEEDVLPAAFDRHLTSAVGVPHKHVNTNTPSSCSNGTRTTNNCHCWKLNFCDSVKNDGSAPLKVNYKVTYFTEGCPNALKFGTHGGFMIRVRKASLGSSDGKCTYGGGGMEFVPLGCPNADGTVTPISTCSTKVGDFSTTHPSGYWSPDYYGSTYKGNGLPLDRKSSWNIPAGAAYPDSNGQGPANERILVDDQRPTTDKYGQGPVGNVPWIIHTCPDGSENRGFYTYPNVYDRRNKTSGHVPYTCPNGIYTFTRTITAPGTVAEEMVVEMAVEHTYRTLYKGQFKVHKQTTRRLSDRRRLTTTEELTTDGWTTKFDHTTKAPPAAYKSAASPTSSSLPPSSGGGDSNSDNNSKNNGSTATTAVAATALVVAAVALVVIRSRQAQQQAQQEAQQQHLRVALAADESEL